MTLKFWSLDSGTGGTGPWVAGEHSLPQHITLLRPQKSRKQQNMISFSGQEEAEFGCRAPAVKHRELNSHGFPTDKSSGQSREHMTKAPNTKRSQFSQETENAQGLMWAWAVPYHLVWPSKPLLALWVPKTPSLAPPIISFLHRVLLKLCLPFVLGKLIASFFNF